MSVNLPMYVAGLGLVLLSMVGLLVLLRRSRRGRRPAAPVAVEDVVPATVETAEPVVESTPDEAAHPDVRALRAQVRVLEEALQRAAEATVEQPELASYRNQVRIAVESVGRRTSLDADPRLVAARVSAAVARLDADPAERVVLPTPLRRPVAVAPVVPERAPEPAPEPEPEVEPVDEPVVVDEEVVLPVPPPASDEPRRGKRRTRRSAA